VPESAGEQQAAQRKLDINHFYIWKVIASYGSHSTT
jgi:hypothetical protein